MLGIKEPYVRYKWASLILLISFIGFSLYDSLLLNDIHQKEHSSYLRIGYVNLHQSKISLDELKKLSYYNCDIWMFLEWNGDNLNSDPGFLKNYIKYQIINKKTFGICVLAKSAAITVTEMPRNGVSYLCDYPKHVIKNRVTNDLNIFLLHAPPPVPSCGFETKKYISDFSLSLSKNEN